MCAEPRLKATLSAVTLIVVIVIAAGLVYWLLAAAPVAPDVSFE